MPDRQPITEQLRNVAQAAPATIAAGISGLFAGHGLRQGISDHVAAEEADAMLRTISGDRYDDHLGVAEMIHMANVEAYATTLTASRPRLADAILATINMVARGELR